MSSPDVAGMLDQSKELDRLRKDQEEILIEINKLHKKLQSSESHSHLMLVYSVREFKILGEIKLFFISN